MVNFGAAIAFSGFALYAFDFCFPFFVVFRPLLVVVHEFVVFVDYIG